MRRKQRRNAPTVVYADILICINLIVNYALLAVSGRFCQRKPHRLRMLAAAFVGAVYALVLFARNMPAWGLVASKIGVSVAMVWIALPWHGMREFAKRALVFWITGFLFAGAMLALWLFAAPHGMLYSNGVVYFDLSAIMLVGFTAVAYGIATIFSRIFQKQGVAAGMYDVILELGERRVLLRGFLDTGNSLQDAYTGYPVAVCALQGLQGLLPSSLWELFDAITRREDFSKVGDLLSRDTKNKFKLIPFSAVGASGVLPAFLPDRMELRRGKQRFEVENVYIAATTRKFAGGSYEVLLGPALLPLELPADKSSSTNGKHAYGSLTKE